jgi:hypothetical protein
MPARTPRVDPDHGAPPAIPLSKHSLFPGFQGVSMFSHPHNPIEPASRGYGEGAAYFLLTLIVVLFLIVMFINPALPKGWLFGLL